jgi:hypothetical protein
MLPLEMLPLQGQLSLHVKLVKTYFTPAIFSHPGCSHVLFLHPAAQYLDGEYLWKWHAKRRVSSGLGVAVVGSLSPSGEFWSWSSSRPSSLNFFNRTVESKLETKGRDVNLLSLAIVDE